MIYNHEFVNSDFYYLLSVYILDCDRAKEIFLSLKDDREFFNLINLEQCVVIEKDKIRISNKSKFEKENHLNILPF